MTLSPETRALLGDGRTPIAGLMKALAAAEVELAAAPEVVIGLSANVTIDLLGLFLRREAALAGLRARIVMGNYDDPIGDVERFAAAGVQRVVLLPFLDNVQPAFEAQAATRSLEERDALEDELRSRYRLALAAGRRFTSIHVGLYHRFGESSLPDGQDAVADTVEQLNTMLRAEAAPHANVQLIDVGRSVTAVGREAAFDRRFYYRAKAPYAAALLSDLARRLAAGTRGFGTRFLKALVLDCDNTLWGGVIGEDLIDGIRLDPFDYPGNVFWRVQQAIAALERQGVLLCLCTKNNPADVADVMARHPHMVLREEQIVARRVNWADKVSNLVALGEELNIGLDSMVFLDDSAVEVEAVRARLPQVTVYQVPAQLTDYPAVLDEIARLFLGAGARAESQSKTEQYRLRAAASEAKASFATHEEYLASLGLEAALHRNRPSEAPRIAELSQKSNQFNLTTRRYTQGEVEQLMAAPDADIFSITVRNRFGEAGLTGVITVRYEGDRAVIENFLMSCRVLGQGVEFAIWSRLADHLAERGVAAIEADYHPTAKNAQVADFYDRLGLGRADDSGAGTRYSHPVAGLTPPASSWVKVTDA